MLKQVAVPSPPKTEPKARKKAKACAKTAAAPPAAAAGPPNEVEGGAAGTKEASKSLTAKERKAADNAKRAELAKAKRKEKAGEVKEQKKAAAKAIAAKAAPAKRRGLSLEEKCCRFEGHLAKTEEIFTLKELEKIGPTIGVIPQAVKDVITGLLKERRIKCEKVGASNIYWLFKHDLAESRCKEKQSLEREIEQLRAALRTLEESVGSVDEAAVLEFAKMPAQTRAKTIGETSAALTDSRLRLREVEAVRAICPARFRSLSSATLAMARRAAAELDFSDEMNFGL